jgi:hypothetical protein
MPYQLRKVHGKPCFRITNKKTKRIFARCTSKIRAKKQLTLLRALAYNKNFVPRSQLLRRSKRIRNQRIRTQKKQN